jgi:hypothetical protein
MHHHNSISPAWDSVSRPLTNASDVKGVMTKGWVVGFTEGSFFILQKEPGRLVHAFGITQKLDGVVVEVMRMILHIAAKVVFREFYAPRCIPQTRDYEFQCRTILNIAEYYANTMKGMKAVEYKIWARAIKYKGDLAKMTKARDTLTLARSPWSRPRARGRSAKNALPLSSLNGSHALQTEGIVQTLARVRARNDTLYCYFVPS